MAPSSRPEPVGALGERRLVVRLKQQAHHLTDELVTPGRQAEWPGLPAVLLRDVYPAHGGEPVALVAHGIDDAVDLSHRHAIHGLLRGTGRHRALVGVDP